MALFKKAFRFLVFVVILAALAAGAILVVKKKKEKLAGAPRHGVRPLPVKAVSARRGDLPVRIHYLAVVEPVRRATVSARLTSTVEEVLVDEGDAVRAGDVLLRMDAREIRDGIDAVEARIAGARADLASNQALVVSLTGSTAFWKREAERDRTLAKKKDIPLSQAEATEDKLTEFTGRLNAARKKSEALDALIRALEKSRAGLTTRLSYCTLVSPYNGVVARRLVDPGDLAAPGKELFIVEDRGTVKLAFDIPQEDLPEVREGLSVTFSVKGEVRKAVLSHLYPSFDPTRMLRAEVKLTGPAASGLSVGEYVSLAVTVKVMRGVTLIPASAIVERPGGGRYVFLVRDGVLEPREVEVLGRSRDEAALAGIRPGDRLVSSTFLGWAVLSAGNRVEVME